MIKRLPISLIIMIGFALFSMLFGVGNLIYPVLVGYVGGSQHIFTISSFIISAICFPLAGLIGISLFDGDYQSFFYRLGRPAGFFFMVFCLVIIGPLIGMPRLISLTYTMISPFIPSISFTLFSFTLLLITLCIAFYKEKLIYFLGYIVCPLLFTCLLSIIFIGLMGESQNIPSFIVDINALWKSISYGLGTLDLLATIFFSSFVIKIIKQKSGILNARQTQLFIIMRAGIIGSTLLTIVYLGLSHLGAYYGFFISRPTIGNIFIPTALRAFGGHTITAGFVVSITVLLASLSTLIALAVVVSQYSREIIFSNKISYQATLLGTILTTLVASYFNFIVSTKLLTAIITFGYPALIVLTLCNICYKLFNFTPVKIPVALTLLITLLFYIQ